MNFRLPRLVMGLFVTSTMLIFEGRPAVAYEFTAQGTWTIPDQGLTDTWRADYDIAGGQIGGSMSIDGLPGVSEGHMLGTISGTVVTFVLSRGPSQPASFEGTLTGGRFAGTFHTSVGASGRWSGTVSPSGSTPRSE